MVALCFASTRFLMLSSSSVRLNHVSLSKRIVAWEIFLMSASVLDARAETRTPSFLPGSVRMVKTGSGKASAIWETTVGTSSAILPPRPAQTKTASISSMPFRWKQLARFPTSKSVPRLLCSFTGSSGVRTNLSSVGTDCISAMVFWSASNTKDRTLRTPLRSSCWLSVSTIRQPAPPSPMSNALIVVHPHSKNLFCFYYSICNHIFVYKTRAGLEMQLITLKSALKNA